MVTPYYGCEGAHAEHTCLQAYYTGPKKFRRYIAWCEWCRDHYRFPEA